MLAAAKDLGSARWTAYFEPLPGPAAGRRARWRCAPTANRCRAAYGVKDSVRDVLPEAVTEPFLEAVDRLIRELNRATA